MVPCHAVTVVFENASSLARSTVQSPKPLEMTKSGELGMSSDSWTPYGPLGRRVSGVWKQLLRRSNPLEGSLASGFAGTGRMAVLSEPIIYLKKSKNGSGSNISQFQCERKNDDDLWPNNM